MDSFEQIAESHELWLTERIMLYARDARYHEYSSISYETWRSHIAALSASLGRTISSETHEPEHPDDPLTDFVISEAQRHRERGVSLGEFISLIKCYRKTYNDLIHHVELEDSTSSLYQQDLNASFDRVEIELCDQWHTLGEEKRESSGTDKTPKPDHEQTKLLMQERDAQHALRESEQKLEGIVGSMTDNLIMIDDDFRILWANDVAKRLFGSDLADRKCYQVLCNELTHCQKCAIADCMADGKPHDIEKTVVLPDGEALQFWCTANIATRYQDGRPKTYVQIMRDVTDLKRSQELLLQTEGLRTVSELTSGVAHNFRNLLQVILSAARLAKMEIKDNNPEEADLALDQILRTSYFGAGTIKRIEEFARTTEDVPLKPDEVFDVSLTIAQAIEMSKPWWKSKPQRKGITIHVQRALENGAWVKGQESQLFESIVSLLRNAVEAFEIDGTITVRSWVKNSMVYVSVQDDGPGIATHNIQNVFEPFWTTKCSRGSGMGLATARKTITNHQGSISVQSEAGKGSTFTIKLPLAMGVHQGQETGLQENRRNLSILVIDDVEQAAIFLSKALERTGHKVVSSVSGEDGLSRFKNAHFDAVLCDLCMPEINGLEVGRRIKQFTLERGVKKPVFILITGWADQEIRPEEIEGSGVDGVLEKPADLKQIQSFVSRLIEQKQEH